MMKRGELKAGLLRLSKKELVGLLMQPLAQWFDYLGNPLPENAEVNGADLTDIVGEVLVTAKILVGGDE